jgi:uncharacterized protein YggE
VENKIGGYTMKKIWLGVAGVILVVVAVVGLAGCDSRAEGVTLGGDVSSLNLSLNGQQQGIWTSGEGKVYVTPDMAVLTLGVESQETSVALARDNAAAAMEAVIAAVKAQGIADKDIQTQYFNIQQVTNWDYDKQTENVVGYRVTNTVTIKVRQDLERVADIIDSVVVAGGDLTRVSGIDFTIEEPRPYFEQARAKAIEYAIDKAQQLADEAGVNLGDVTYISESSVNYYSYGTRNYAGYEDAMAVPMPTVPTSISVGELEITATVQIAYAIAD